MKTVLLLLLVSFASANAHTVGSGGDELRDLFNQARSAATYDLEHIQWCSFTPSTAPDIKDWILNNSQKFADDLQTADQRWVVDTQPTCAFTEHTSRAPIYLSYPTCANTVGTNLTSAIFTLLHETAHHLGIDDEHRADAIASAVMSANISVTCPAPTVNVFDADYCPGPAFSADDARKYLTPGTPQAAIGSYLAYARHRQCTALSGCGAWMPDKLSAYSDMPLDPVKAVLKTSPGTALGFSMDVRQGVNGSASTVLSAVDIVSGSGQYSNGANYAYVFSGSDLLGNSYSAKVNANFNKTCLWMKIPLVTAANARGYHEEGEIVIYGTH